MIKQTKLQMLRGWIRYIFYGPDYNGFADHLDKHNDAGLPTSLTYLRELSQVYHCPIPVEYKIRFK